MSEYVWVTTQFKDKECLELALEDCGLVEFEEGQKLSLNGYQNGRTAQIVIRRKNLGTTADVGFALEKKGKLYVLIVDSDDRRKIEEKLKSLNLNAKYAYRVVRKLARQNNYAIVAQSKKKSKTRITLRRWG